MHAVMYTRLVSFSILRGLFLFECLANIAGCDFQHCCVVVITKPLISSLAIDTSDRMGCMFEV